MLRIINVVLSLIAIALGVLLWQSIQRPIKVQKQIAERTEAVQDRMIQIREAQEAYKNVTDEFAPTFDSLFMVLKTDSFKVTNPVTSEVTVTPIIDSLYKGDLTAMNALKEIPFSGGKNFQMASGFLPNPVDTTNYIPVFEIRCKKEDFLAPEGDVVNRNFWKNDRDVRLGSLTSPKLTGNWE